MGPVSGCSAIPAARTPLFKGGPKVYQLSAILVDLGFEFAELFKLSLVSPHGGGHRGSLPQGSCGQGSLEQSASALSYGGGVRWVSLLTPHVKTFM
jgi:hypothetical protein